MRPRNHQWSPAAPPRTATPRGQAAPVQAEASLTLERFAGQWHELARLPAPFQQGWKQPGVMHYAIDPAQQALTLQARQEGASAPQLTSHLRQPRPFDEPAQLQMCVRPAWLGWLPGSWIDHWVLARADDYEWAIVGDPARSYLWLLSRRPTMEREQFDQLKSRARRMGFDLAPLIVSPRRAG